MKKFLLSLLALAFVLTAPSFGQDVEIKEEGKKEMAKKEMPGDEQKEEMKAPAPLTENEFCSWMVGEWVGTSTSSQGTSDDWMKVSIGLDGNFVMSHYKGTMTGGEWEGYTYEGMGHTTQDPETGEWKGFWVGSMRDMATGSGEQMGDKVTMTWESQKGSYLRTTEKVGPNKMVVTFKEVDNDGNVVSEGRSEYTRKKKES